MRSSSRPTGLLVLAWGLGGAGACARPPTPGAPTPAPGVEPARGERVEITETTVGELGGVRVPMGNMTTGSYLLPDGRQAQGPICSLALPDQVGVFVGVGSELRVGGLDWRVVAIDKVPGQLGTVVLERIEGP